jgi:ribosome-associated toxin RatA of RatAB toxin-antitoxin module
METLTYGDSVIVNCSPESVYDMVSDVTRMGEWSPECKSCIWEGEVGPVVGEWFIGTNVDSDHEWKTRCVVVAAQRGQEFAFVVEGFAARWGFKLEKVDQGTRVSETWEFPPAARARFEYLLGEGAEERIAYRAKMAQIGITATLTAIKRAAESS